MLVHTVGEHRGPLQYLLALIEQEALPVTDISLAALTDEFIGYLRDNPVPVEEAADWVHTAARLLYLKAAILSAGEDADDVEDGVGDLARQLQALKAFKTAERLFVDTWNSSLGLGPFSHRLRLPGPEPRALVMQDTVMWREALRRMSKKLARVAKTTPGLVRRLVSINELMDAVVERLNDVSSINVRMLCADASDKAEAVGFFLAVLELLKQRRIVLSDATHHRDVSVSMLIR